LDIRDFLEKIKGSEEKKETEITEKEEKKGVKELSEQKTEPKNLGPEEKTEETKEETKEELEEKLVGQEEKEVEVKVEETKEEKANEEPKVENFKVEPEVKGREGITEVEVKEEVKEEVQVEGKEEGKEEGESSIEVPPFFDGTVKAEAERKVFELFNEKVKEVIDKSVVEKIVLSEGVSFYEAIVKGDFLSETSLYKLVKQVLWELRVPRVAFSLFASAIEVKGNRYFALIGDREVEVVPTFSPIEAVETSKRGKVALVLPISQVKILKTLTALSFKKKVEKHPKIEEILQKALAMGTSDVHIIPKERGFHTFFRIKKQLVEVREFFMTKEQWKIFSDELRIRIANYTIGNFSVDDYKSVQEGRAEFPELNVSIRYEYIPDGHSLKYGEIVIRILKKESVSGKVPLSERLKKFGYDEKTINLFKTVLELEGGLVIVSGKTNSGKSTLVSNLLVSIPSERKVATAEDPIEYSYSPANVVQHQLYLPPEGEKLDYEAYVKAFKRADTDVIFIGEWRKQEGLTSAMVEQAQAGQLIFTTLHITSAFEVYKALWDIFEVPYSVSSSLILFSFNQSLFPKLCPHCSKEVEVSFSEQEVALLRQLTESEKERLLSFRGVVKQRDREKAKNCPYCGGTGYSGLVPVYEYFIPDETIRNKLVSLKDEFTPLKIKEHLIESGAKEKGLAVFKIDRALSLLKEGILDKSFILRI